jgi:regulatory protein
MSMVIGIRRVGAGSVVEISLAGGERLRVDERRLLERELVPGADLGQASLDTLRDWQRIDWAERRLLRLLARRQRSRAELARACSRWRLGGAEADALLDRLAEAGMIDDRALAGRLADQRRASGHGRLRIEHDLRRLGIDPASAPVGENDSGELSRARAELARRFGDRTPLAPGDRARAAAHLGRRGFDSDTVAEALGLDAGY